MSHVSRAPGLRRPLARSLAILPRLDDALPAPDLLIVTSNPLPLDARQHLLGCFQSVRVPLSPYRREFSLKSMLEHGLAVSPESLTCRPQHCDPSVEFGEEFLDLGDDAPLFGCRWEWDGLVGKIRGRNSTLADSAGHVPLCVSAKLDGRYEPVQVVGADLAMWSQDVEFGGSETESVFQPRNDGHLPVFHARCDLGKEHVSFAEGPITLPDVVQTSSTTYFDDSRLRFDSRHGHE